MNQFDIKILSQHWLEFDDAEAIDLCSHGKILLKVKGIEITNEEDDITWGISETALSLLRSVVYDYPEKRGDDTMIFHGCGTILMAGCPIRISWNTVHEDKRVFLQEFKKFPTTNENDVITYPGLQVTMGLDTYASICYKFAEQAKSFFHGIDKDIKEKMDKQMYRNFWFEYNELLAKVRAKTGSASF